MKKVQITHELFTELIKYHLLDMEDGAEKIQTALNEKLDALVKFVLMENLLEYVVIVHTF